MMPILLPSRLERDPAVVHETLAHLDEREASGTRRGDMIAHEVDVGLDRHGLARGAVEVCRHPGRHDEVRVVADEHVDAARPEQP